MDTYLSKLQPLMGFKTYSITD